MDMKKLLNIVSESKIAECEMTNPASMAPQTPPVSMSVNLNAQGIDQIKDLLSLMNKADSPLSAGPVVDKPMPMPMPMPTVGMDTPMAISLAEPKPQAEPDVDPLASLIKTAGLPAKPKDDEETASKKEMQSVADDVKELTDEFANAPNETVAGIDAVIPSGDDLHRAKKQYPKAQDGDNPMAVESIRALLDARYKEIKESKKSKPDFLDVDKDGDKEEPMKKAMKDKEVKEGFPTVADAKARAEKEKTTGKFDKKDVGTGTQYTRKSSTFSDGGDDSDTKKAKAKAKAGK